LSLLPCLAKCPYDIVWYTGCMWMPPAASARSTGFHAGTEEGHRERPTWALAQLERKRTGSFLGQVPERVSAARGPFRREWEIMGRATST